MHNYSQLAGVTNFIECQALKGGGGLQTRNGSLTVLKGNMVFLACTATGAGGGADVGLDVYLHAKASMAFDKCHAGGDGGGPCALQMWNVLTASDAQPAWERVTHKVIKSTPKASRASNCASGFLSPERVNTI